MTGNSPRTISDTFNGLQSELDSLKNLTGVALANGIVDLKSKLLDARIASVDRISELEAKIAEYESWEKEAQRYQPMQFEPGVTVYIEKGAQLPVLEVQHYCPGCFANRKVRFLQGTDSTEGRRKKRVCLECNTALAYGPQGPMPQVRSAISDRSSWMSR